MTQDFAVVHLQSRRAASSLASCFSQFAHKATTVFQNNAKLEAELVHLREEVAAALAASERATRERLHATALLQVCYGFSWYYKLVNYLSCRQLC